MQGAGHRLQRHRAMALRGAAAVLGCDDWITARATTCGELDAVLRRAEKSDAGAYIEVVTDAYAAPELMLRLSDKMKGSKK